MKQLLHTMVKTTTVFLGCLAFLALAMFVATSGEYVVPKTVAEDPSLPRIEIGGHVYHGETFGDPRNPALIVVHGGPGWDYRSLLPLKALSDRFFVVFYDQRGSGLSPREGASKLTLETSLSDLDTFVDHFGEGKRVSLIGHSWGAMLVAGYLGRHPGKVSHAVLAEPGFLTTEMMSEAGIRFGPLWEAGFLAHATRAWFASLHVSKPDPDAAADYFMGQVAPRANPEYYCGGIVPPAGTDYWRVGARVMQAILRSAADADGNIRIDLTKGLENYSRKVLLLASECSRIGKDHQQRQARFFPHADVVVIRNSGHMVFAEQPEQSIAPVRKFLQAPDEVSRQSAGGSP